MRGRGGLRFRGNGFYHTLYNKIQYMIKQSECHVFHHNAMLSGVVVILCRSTKDDRYQ